MSLLFGKKQTAQALAEVLEDGRAIINQEMKKAKYNENQAILDRNPQLVKKQ